MTYTGILYRLMRTLVAGAYIEKLKVKCQLQKPEQKEERTFLQYANEEILKFLECICVKHASPRFPTYVMLTCRGMGFHGKGSFRVSSFVVYLDFLQRIFFYERRFDFLHLIGQLFGAKRLLALTGGNHVLEKGGGR